MPNAHPDESPVTWGRWNEAHQGVLHRLDALEHDTAEQYLRIEANERLVASAEENRRTLATRVTEMAAQVESRRSHVWTLATLVLTSLVLPILVVLLTVWLHLNRAH